MASWFELEVTSEEVLDDAVGIFRRLPYQAQASWFELEVTSEPVGAGQVGTDRRLPYAIVSNVGVERSLPYAVTETVGLQRTLTYAVAEPGVEPESQPEFVGGGQTGTIIGGPITEGQRVEFRQRVIIVRSVPFELRVLAQLHLLKRFSTFSQAEIQGIRSVNFSTAAERTPAQRWSRLRAEDDELLALLSD